ncbi:hypothetical protein SDC9_92360 [bioreactor metagenome]|uniref:Uncharacterized protein n=1 Tax=bioreactor metagenome TaxID=1076179 RepID=A0A644ZXG8_9ZZZZ
MIGSPVIVVKRAVRGGEGTHGGEFHPADRVGIYGLKDFVEVAAIQCYLLSRLYRIGDFGAGGGRGVDGECTLDSAVSV